jgi:hypothetical protein
MMISESSIIKKSGDLIMSVIDKEAVILGVENGMYVGLNEMGTEIWSRLDEPVSVSNLIEALVNIYDEEEAVIKDQVMEFLGGLLEKSLIDIANET